MERVIIVGYSDQELDRIVQEYAEKALAFRIGMRSVREGNVCHISVGEDILSPKVIQGYADVLMTKTADQAAYMISYLSPSGRVIVEEQDGDDPESRRYKRHEMWEYLKKQVPNLSNID